MRFFFSSRRRHTRFDCDWSSDVCSSDLVHVLLIGGEVTEVVVERAVLHREHQDRVDRAFGRGRVQDAAGRYVDRKSVVYGKSVDLGGRRIIKKKNRQFVWLLYAALG